MTMSQESETLAGSYERDAKRDLESASGLTTKEVVWADRLSATVGDVLVLDGRRFLLGSDEGRPCQGCCCEHADDGTLDRLCLDGRCGPLNCCYTEITSAEKK
jgi:hypothetical protein